MVDAKDNVITDARPMQQAHGNVVVLEIGSKGWYSLYRRQSLLLWSAMAVFFAASSAIVVATIL